MMHTITCQTFFVTGPLLLPNKTVRGHRRAGFKIKNKSVVSEISRLLIFFKRPMEGGSDVILDFLYGTISETDSI